MREKWNVESGQLVHVKVLFLWTDSFANETSLVWIHWWLFWFCWGSGTWRCPSERAEGSQWFILPFWRPSAELFFFLICSRAAFVPHGDAVHQQNLDRRPVKRHHQLPLCVIPTVIVLWGSRISAVPFWWWQRCWQTRWGPRRWGLPGIWRTLPSLPWPHLCRAGPDNVAFPPEVHDDLVGFSGVQWEVVHWTLRSQALYLIPVCSFVSSWDEPNDCCVISKFDEDEDMIIPEARESLM